MPPNFDVSNPEHFRIFMDSKKIPFATAIEDSIPQSEGTFLTKVKITEPTFVEQVLRDRVIADTKDSLRSLTSEQLIELYNAVNAEIKRRADVVGSK